MQKKRERLPFTGLGGKEGPTWRGSARLVRQAVDVGLEFSLPFFQEKGRKKDPQSTKISYL